MIPCFDALVKIQFWCTTLMWKIVKMTIPDWLPYPPPLNINIGFGLSYMTQTIWAVFSFCLHQIYVQVMQRFDFKKRFAFIIWESCLNLIFDCSRTAGSWLVGSTCRACCNIKIRIDIFDIDGISKFEFYRSSVTKTEFSVMLNSLEWIRFGRFLITLSR